MKQQLQELGSAINESISNSEEVNRQIQRIRDEGYDVYVVLDATIGLNRLDGEGAEETAAAEGSSAGETVGADVPVREVQFRINVNDLTMLRSLGIDPTRKVKSVRRIGPVAKTSDD